MFKRNITDAFLEALEDTPVVLMNGSRQVGKSTFVKNLLNATHDYYTLDDPTILTSARQDPMMFVEGLQVPSILDEVQRAPQLFLPLKKTIDDFRRPGFFVLTGSANVLSLPNLADSLAGRLEIHTLWPLSQGEILGKKEDFIHQLFGNNLFGKNYPPYKSDLSLTQLIDLIVRGGYPDVINRTSPQRRRKWFSSYLTTVLEKDIRDLSHIEGLLDLPNLIQLFASRCGSLLNLSEISRSIGIPHTTLKRYLALLEKIYLLISLPAWTKNLSKRLIKTPKIYLNDTGLLTHLVTYDQKRLLNDKLFLGHVLENFVVMELKKQMTWSQQICQIYHYRNLNNQEIDVILEAPDSKVVAIEIKLSHSVSASDFSAIKGLEEELGDTFHRGIVLYMGERVVPFGINKHAVPLSILWNHPEIPEDA